jgi:hypothetical protein
MGINIAWDNDARTIFRYDFEPEWTWDEFFAAKEQAKPLLDAAPHQFAVLINATQMSHLPPDSLANARHALRSGHPNAFLIVLVIQNAVVRATVITLRDIAPLAPRTIEITATLDDARALVRERLLTHKTTPNPDS